MARKRRLQSDSEEEEEGDQEILEESPQAKKKRLSSAKDVGEDETMEEDDFNCSQAPDFTVTTVSKFACLIPLGIGQGSITRFLWVSSWTIEETLNCKKLYDSA